MIWFGIACGILGGLGLVIIVLCICWDGIRRVCLDAYYHNSNLYDRLKVEQEELEREHPDSCRHTSLKAELSLALFKIELAGAILGKD